MKKITLYLLINKCLIHKKKNTFIFKLLFVLLFSITFNLKVFAGDIWTVMLTNGTPVQTNYLGDVLGDWYVQFEVGQTWWNATDVGIGTSNSVGANWATANWYADNGGNKRVQRNLYGFKFTSTGNWYIYGRAKADADDAWHYANNLTWSNSGTLNAAYYFTVNDLPKPTSCSATKQSTSRIDLKWTRNGTYTTVIIVVRKGSAPNDLSQGTAYSQGSGDINTAAGYILYKGSGDYSSTAYQHTGLDGASTYYYKYFTVNNDYYSPIDANTTKSATTDAPPETAQDGDWNTGSTWVGGSVPAAGLDLIIKHAVTVNSAVANTANSVTINSGKSLNFGANGSLNVTNTITNNGSIIMTSGGTITLNNGGTFANGASTFTGGTGTVNFAGNGTVSGTITFNNVTIAGGVNFGSSSTVNGTLQIYTGGWVNTNCPVYGAASTLKYNTGGVYGRNLEWSANNPANVQISNSTSLDLGANGGTGTARTITGNLTIDNLSALYMDYSSDDMTTALTVNGNIDISGTLSLSDAAGGDLNVKGNWTKNGTFNHKGRAVTFNGSSAQQINSATTFGYLTIDNAAGVSLNSVNITIANQINLKSGTFTVGSTYTVTMNSGTTVAQTSGSLAAGNGAGIFEFSGTGTITGTITFYTIYIYGGVNFGSNSTINGVLSIYSGGFVDTNPPTYGSGSVLNYRTGGTYNRGLEWSSTSGAGYPANVQLDNATKLNLGYNGTGTERRCSGSLNLITGSELTMNEPGSQMTAPLKVGGVIQFSVATITLSALSGGDLYFAGSYWEGSGGTFTPNSRAVFFTGSTTQTLYNDPNITFDYLIINKTGSLQLHNEGVGYMTDIVINKGLTITSGNLDLNGNNITYGATAFLKYDGASSQTTTDNEFPVNSGPKDLTIDNASGVILHAARTINGTVTFTNGKITLGSNTLTLGSSATINGASATKYFIATGLGTLKKEYSGTGSFDYPLGSSGAYSPATLNFTSGSFAGGAFAEINLVASKHTNNTSATNFINRYWTVNSSAISGFSCNATFTYADADINGSEAAIYCGKYSSGSWSVFNVANAGSNQLSATISSFSDFSGGEFTAFASSYETAQDGDWNTGSTWVGGSVPPADKDITIKHIITVNSAVANTATSVTINNGKSISFGASGSLTINSTLTNNGTIDMTNGGSISIAGGGTFANGTNTFTGGTGTVIFNGSGTITGTIVFNNITINGGVNFGTGSTVNGTLQINTGGWVNTNCPTYGATSTLKYNTGGTYGRSKEWDAKNPANVYITNSTKLNISNGATGTERTITGNLTIDALSELTGNVITDEMTATLNINGNILNAGTINVGGTPTGHLKIKGDFTNSGNFSNDNATVTFNGSSAQQITGTTSFRHMAINNTGGVTLNNSITTRNLWLNSSLDIGNNTLNSWDISGSSSLIARASGVVTALDITVSNLITTGGASITCTDEWNVTNFTKSTSTIIFNGATVKKETLFYNLTNSGSTTTIEANIDIENNLTISGGTLKSSSGRTITMSGATGTINLSGGTISGTDEGAGNDLTLVCDGSVTTITGGEPKFYNVTVNAGKSLILSNGIFCKYGTFTMNGTLEIKSGGYIQATSGVAPTYGSSSLLKYNSGTVYGRGLEWSNTSGAGFPKDVTITGSTSLNLGNGGTSTSRELSGNLTIDTGSALYMDYGADDMTAALTIDGNLTNDGVISLSDASGGDLNIKGNWINNSTFNCKGRSVKFAGILGAQTLSGTTAPTINYMTIDNTGSGLLLNCDVNIINQLTLTIGNITLGSYNLILSATASVSGTPSSSNMVIASGSGVFRKLFTGSGSFTYPIGNIGAYTPITLNFTSGAFAGGAYAEANLTPSKHTLNSSASHFINRYWTIVSNGITVFNCNVTATYINGDITGTETNLYCGKYSGGSWDLLDAVNAGANQLTGTVNSFSDFTGGEMTAFTGGVYETAQDGNWNVGATWVGGSVPPGGSVVTIKHAVILNQDASVSDITINAGKSLTSEAGQARTLTIASGGTFINNGTFTANDGTVIYAGAGTATGTITYNNVNISGGVDLGTTPTINGTLTINAGAAVLTHAPAYGALSKLLYNTGDHYGRSTEWSSTSGAGYPNDVQISGNTFLDLGNGGTGTARQIAGSLTIDNGSTLSTNEAGHQMTAKLTVNGNITINGALTLSSQSGADLVVKGNFTNNGTFSSNDREIEFYGTTAQTINTGVASSTSFSYIDINNAAGVTIQTVKSNNIDISKRLKLSGGTLTVGNGNTITMAGSIGNGSEITGSGGDFAASADAGTVICSGKCDIYGALNFYNLTLNNQGGSGPGDGVNFINNATINGTLQINANAFVDVNAPNYATGSTLKYNNGGGYDRRVEWSALSGAGYPYNVLITNNSELRIGFEYPGVAKRCAGNLTIDNGAALYMDFYDMTQPLTVLGNILNNGIFTLSDLAGGDLVIKGNFTNNNQFYHKNRLVTFNGSTTQQITGSTNFAFLTIDNSNGITLNSNIAIDNNITLTNGIVTTGTNYVIINANAGMSRTNGYINGNIKRMFNTGAQSFTFLLGTLNGYSPLALSIVNVTGAGSITAKAIQNVHPNALDPANALGRYWTLTSGDGITFTTFNATFTYLAADFVAPFLEATYEASMLWGKYNTDWTYPTVGTRTTAGAGGSIEVTGLASFSDYTGMGCTPPSIDNHPSNANKCIDEPASFTVVASGTSPTYQWQINDGSWTNLTNTGVYSNVTESTMNISDVTGLDGKEYHCVVTACSSEETSNTATLTVTSCSGTATWAGGNAGNETRWDIAANWNINQIPGIDNDVIIPTNPAGGAYFPVISSIAVCKNLQIDPKASLTISGGNSLTVNGNLTIKSSNTGTGAILDLGTLTITGNVTVERFITGISGYHYICSPINGATLNQIIDDVTLSGLGYGYYNPSNPPTTSNMPNIWWYDETHSTPANDAMEAWKTPSKTDDAMDEMRGYALNISTGTVVDFITTGANLNTGNKQINLTKTSAPGGLGGNGGNGYHIVGNPYPSPIDWDVIQPGLGLNANSTYALFKPSSQWYGGFGYYNPTSGPSGSFFPTRYIAPVQGFYVQAYNNFLMTLNNTVRSVSTEAMNSLFYKKDNNTASKEAKILKLKATNLNTQNAADVAILYFVKDATTGFDPAYDAGKLMNTDPELPNLYTVYNNDNLANNALPEVYDGLKVALVMNVQQKGKYSIEAFDIINFDAGIEIYLDDILTGKSVNLTQNPNYRFNASPDENNRFFIRFTVNNSGINTLTSQNNKVNVYAVNSNIYVNADNSLINKAYISVCNLLGQELFSSKITKDLNKIELNAGNTYYLVRVISDNYTYTQKVFIK